MESEMAVQAALVTDKLASKQEALHQIARQAAEAVGCTAEHLYRALAEREELGSTGFGDGIAIPHCREPGLSEFVLGVMLVPGGVPFDAADGEPVRLFVYIVAPAERATEHVALLASVSRVLGDAGAVAELLACAGEDELRECFRRRWSPPKQDRTTAAKCLLQVFVQREELLTEIVETLCEAVSEHVTVLEGRSASSYLHRLPLFSAFWTEPQAEEVKIITAAVDAAKCNDISRRIMLLAGDRDVPGVLVCAQDLRFVVGELEL